MLSATNYAQNYAGIIGKALQTTYNQPEILGIAESLHQESKIQKV